MKDLIPFEGLPIPEPFKGLPNPGWLEAIFSAPELSRPQRASLARRALDIRVDLGRLAAGVETQRIQAEAMVRALGRTLTPVEAVPVRDITSRGPARLAIQKRTPDGGSLTAVAESLPRIIIQEAGAMIRELRTSGEATGFGARVRAAGGPQGAAIESRAGFGGSASAGMTITFGPNTTIIEY